MAPFSRSSGRERIETAFEWPRPGGDQLSPGLRAGSGLKQLLALIHRDGGQLSPGLRAGSGLKPLHRHGNQRTGALSPGLRAGSGLKLPCPRATPMVPGFLPVFGPGAD